jgi:alkylhydroperoxidase family enzyme
MRTLTKLHDLLMGPGALTERDKILVYMAVAIVNESAYCAKEAEIRARELGVTEEESRDIEAETDYSFPEKERTALRFARELTRTADAERDTLETLDKFFAADERVELTMVIGLANMMSRVANGLRLPSEQAILPVAS